MSFMAPLSRAKPPVAPETDTLMAQLRKVAVLIGQAVGRGDHDTVRGDLLLLGPLASPVMLELAELLTPEQRQEFKEQLCQAAATFHPPPQRAARVLGELVRLHDRLRPAIST